MRRCRRCGRTPEETPFGKGQSKDGFDTYCKECDSQQQKESYQARTPAQREAQSSWGKQYYLQHSEHIKARSTRYHQAKPWVIHNSNHRRLAKELAHYVEPVNDIRVFERDGWVCQLCGETVNPDLRWPDPMSPSLDHVVPIARGGTHEYANVQLAHLVCNLRKGASC